LTKYAVADPTIAPPMMATSALRMGIGAGRHRVSHAPL
jgi:hypothetical protein